MIQQMPGVQANERAPRASGSGGDAPSPKDVRRRFLRARVASAALAVGVAASLAAGGWGVFSYLDAGAAPARVGEAVEASDGFVRVDRVAPEHMAPMQSGKFAASGMSMSSMGMDMAPEGQRRFTVDVALAAGDAPLGYAPDDFRLTGEGVKETGPIRDALEGESVPAGGAVAGSLVFQVPEDAKGLRLSFDGGRPVALDLPPAAEGEGHDHGIPASENGGSKEEHADEGH